MDVDGARPFPGEREPRRDAGQEAEDGSDEGCEFGLPRPEEGQDHGHDAGTGDDGSEVGGPVVGRAGILEHDGEAGHEAAVEDHPPMAHLESLAVRRTWVDVGAEKIEGDDAADGDHGRRHRAGDGHEDEHKQSGGRTGAEQRPQHVWHDETRVHLLGCQGVGIVEPDRSVFNRAGAEADDGSRAPGDGKDDDGHEVVGWDRRVHFRSERLLPEGCVHEHQCKVAELQYEAKEECCPKVSGISS